MMRDHAPLREDAVMVKLPASRIRVGDMIDLERDPHADPRGDNVMLQSELAVVATVEDEGAAIAIGFEGFDVVGFPRHRLLKVVKRAG